MRPMCAKSSSPGLSMLARGSILCSSSEGVVGVGVVNIYSSGMRNCLRWNSQTRCCSAESANRHAQP